MDTVIVKDWYEVITNVPSWIRYKTVRIEYSKNKPGLVLFVPEAKPALELPEFKLRSQFNKPELAYFINRHGGSGFNFAVNKNGVWYRMEKPFVVHNGSRQYVSPEMLEALNLCACMLPNQEYHKMLDRLFEKSKPFLGC